MAAESIVVQGAAKHNLKNIDLVLPRNRLIVITGLSGSGKSSLAFQTTFRLPFHVAILPHRRRGTRRENHRLDPARAQRVPAASRSGWELVRTGTRRAVEQRTCRRRTDSG
jgi:ABC-type glutathione transport system ATPase component